MKLINFVKNLHQDEAGQDLIEYALLAALIATAALGAYTPLATAIAAKFTAIAATITAG